MSARAMLVVGMAVFVALALFALWAALAHHWLAAIIIAVAAWLVALQCDRRGRW